MQRILMAVLLTAILACGGGGGSGGDEAVSGPDSAIAGDGVSQGPITGFGSRVVGGTAWTIPGATIVMDGEEGGFLEADLLQGMVVTIEGSRSTDAYTATTTRVEYDDAIEGPIETKSSGILTTRLTIMKQDVVIVKDQTLFDGTTFSSIAADNVVEISGNVDDSGDIIATLVFLVSSNGTFGTTEVERKGTISAVNQVAGNIVLDGALTVGYDPDGVDTDLDGMPAAADHTAWIGEYVEAKGRLDNHSLLNATTCSGGELCSVALVMDPLPTDQENVDIEGYVTSASSQTNFDVDGRSVDASAATFNPSGASFIDIGALVAVEGDLVAGEIVASTVRQRAGDEKVTATVAALADVNAAAGTVVLGAWTVSTDRSTVLIDANGANSEFDLGDINAGDQLVVLGIDLGGNNLRATHLTRSIP